MVAKKKIVFVLSTDYAGSHLLALRLSSHSKCVSVGELHHLRKKEGKRRKVCLICESDKECPIYSGLESRPVSQFYEQIFENISAFDENKTILIDNSKKPRWAKHFIDVEYETKYIHLIRDPRALVRRWMLSYDTPSLKKKMRMKTARRCLKHAWDIMMGDEENVYIWNWLYENRLITKFIQSNNLDHRLITYHDLVFKADDVLTDIVQWLGLEYEPSQKEYWNFVHHGSGKPAYMKPPEDGKLTFDQRWKSFFDEKEQEVIFNHMGTRDYIEKAGLVYDVNKGLRKKVQK